MQMEVMNMKYVLSKQCSFNRNKDSLIGYTNLCFRNGETLLQLGKRHARHARRKQRSHTLGSSEGLPANKRTNNGRVKRAANAWMPRKKNAAPRTGASHYGVPFDFSPQDRRTDCPHIRNRKNPSDGPCQMANTAIPGKTSWTWIRCGSIPHRAYGL